MTEKISYYIFQFDNALNQSRYIQIYFSTKANVNFSLSYSVVGNRVSKISHYSDSLSMHRLFWHSPIGNFLPFTSEGSRELKYHQSNVEQHDFHLLFYTRPVTNVAKKTLLHRSYFTHLQVLCFVPFFNWGRI